MPSFNIGLPISENERNQPSVRGPNQLLPADDFSVAYPTSAVKLRVPLWGNLESARPKSIPTLLKEVADRYPKHPALAYREHLIKKSIRVSEYEWKFITYGQYYDMVKCCAKAFLRLGLERHCAVCILGYNCPRWFISNLAAIFAGGIAVGIYSNSSSKACGYCIKHSRANIVMVEDPEQLAKITVFQFQYVKAIVQYTGIPRCQGVLTWDELLKLGKKQPEYHLEQILTQIGFNECCTVTFKSHHSKESRKFDYEHHTSYECRPGDKALMFSHDNITWTALSITDLFPVRPGFEKIVSYLPLSKISTQISDIYFSIMNVGCTYFILDQTIDNLHEDEFKTIFLVMLREVKPTKFVALPSLWLKMHRIVMERWKEQTNRMRKWTEWARKKAFEYQANKIAGDERNSCGYLVANNVILNKLKIYLGLSRSTMNAAFAGSLSTEMKKFFLGINMPIADIYGVSESTGYHTMCSDDEYGFGTVGMSFPGTQTSINQPDEDGYGEITMYGRNIFMGYLYNEVETLKVINENGWLQPHDIGMMDHESFLYLAKKSNKDILIMADGEHVPIAPLEDAVKDELWYCHHVVLVGERRRYLTVLLTLRTETAAGYPLDELIPSVRDWLVELGCPARTLSQVLKKRPHRNLVAAIRNALDKINEQSHSQAHHIKKFAILPTDLCQKAGEITARGKVKRSVVLERYIEVVDQMYSESRRLILRMRCDE